MPSLPLQAIIRGVPFIRQQTNYWCGPAVVQMILARHGIEIGQRKLAGLAKTNKTGTKYPALIAVLKKHGLKASARRSVTVAQLKKYVVAGASIVINYLEPDEDEGHYAVVIGYSDRGLLLHDPYHGPRYHLSWVELRRRWHDVQNGRRIKRLLIVVESKTK